MQKTVVTELNNTTVRRTIKSVIMDELMKEMQALNDQREAEMRSLRTKCNEHEAMTTAFKKILQVDKLQMEFDAYKQSASAKIKSLEDSLAQAQKTIENLNQERKTVEDTYRIKNIEMQNQFTKDRKSVENKLQKKIDSLEKELTNERARYSKLEETVSKLESKPKEKQDTNGALNLKQFPVPHPVPNSTVIDLVNNAVNISNGPKQLPKISLTPITHLTQGPSPKRRKS